MTQELKQAAQQALEACPFCGADPQDAHHIEYGRWAVTCKCGASGASANTGPNATDAAKIKAYSDARTAWNTRALNQRPAAQTWDKNADVCKGAWELGTACGTCAKCIATKPAQRPAAQTEREADGLPLIVAGAIFDFAGFMTTRAEVIEVGSTADAGPVADLVKEWAELRGLDLADAAVLSWQLHITRASLPAPQQATPDQFADASKMVSPVALRSVRLTRGTAGMCVVRVNGRVAIRDNGDIIDHTATLEWFADTQPAAQATPDHAAEIARLKAVIDQLERREILAVAQQATPEPVGEPFGYFRALPFGWEQCGEHDDGAVALYDRPAPGVPDAEDLRDRLVAISAAVADSDDRAAQSMLGETLRLLAAAQAKGDDK